MSAFLPKTFTYSYIRPDLLGGFAYKNMENTAGSYGRYNYIGIYSHN